MKKNTSKFNYEEIKLVEPDFNSPLTDLIIEHEHLRKRQLGGTTPAQIFFQLKSIFHFLESLGSLRLEGNHTTVDELIEAKSSRRKKKVEDQIAEIFNVEEAMRFIDNSVEKNKIDKLYISQIHKLVVSGLDPEKEGDYSPGIYRKKNVEISQSKHIPPDFTQVGRYMEKLQQFMDDKNASKYDLLKIALFHHRFVWIHPFGNGNGRTVRLITYAQLVKYGFNVKAGRIINPTAVFCNDRGKYNLKLSKADAGTNNSLLDWSAYVLSGLKVEIEKIDRLLDYNYLSKNILFPSIHHSFEHKVITTSEAEIMKIAVKKESFSASDLKEVFFNKSPSHISREIRKLRDKKMVISAYGKKTKYLVNFESRFLIRGVFQALEKNGFASIL